jgi:hypothetical protein
MQLIVDSVNIFLTSPIHLAHIKVRPMSESLHILQDLILYSNSHLHSVHQLGFANIVYVPHIFILNFVHPHGF